MPVVQPGELWEESGALGAIRPRALSTRGSPPAAFLPGPTKEVITQIARSEIKSYKQLPVNLFQIQTKFRDEVVRGLA